ncbi:Splicing factor 3A subunit 1 [Aphelenchoides besseyi]|nr:Splicing factor 3A subunit 1 [Aphelenchoides besseyi]KAI6221137.1 Splicing factor 3A subunit 1 [Aphelenchoides besseyi]
MATEVLRVSNREEDMMNNEPSLSGKSIVGLIIPPPDVRAIVEKTAQFVARNGIDFENKIKEKEAQNPRFGFLSPTDPYHAYYRSKVSMFETGVAQEIAQPKTQLPEAIREHVQQAELIPKNPPPAYEFMADPATINAFDLDLMRMTAMFVARNGRNFMTNLMQREHRNHQFDFLKPQHSNFPYFTKLVEQYTKVIIPPRSVIDDLARTLNFDLILGDVKYRVAWEKHQRATKEREDKAIEEERRSYNQIDWHDFVVVQTVDFQPSEILNLPPLCSARDVGSRILQQQRTEAAKAAAELVEMEMDTDSEEEDTNTQKDQQRAAYEVTQPAPAFNADSALVRDYDPRKDRAQQVKKPQQEKFIISPLTNQKIEADKLQDHVRYSTFDPKYKEQRNQEHTDDHASQLSASGTEISRNIARLAERRTDIFGVGAQGGEQTAIGRKLGEEEAEGPQRVDTTRIWDGRQETIDLTTRLAQQQAERFAAASAAPIPQPPQQAQLGGSLIQTPLMAPPTSFQRPPMPDPYAPIPTGAPPQMAAYDPSPFGANESSAPPFKRPRLEDQLESEAEWLAKVNGAITLTVITPVSTEWNLTGQPIQLSIDVKSTVSALKQLIQEKTTVPTSKQKLSYENMYPKDTNSLAFYNMNNGHAVLLQLKERGGRKK